MKLLPTMFGKPTRLLSGLALCVAPLSANAEEPPTSRTYPPTYTERVTPWYDPSGWFRRIESSFSSGEAVDSSSRKTIGSSGSPTSGEGMIRGNPDGSRSGSPAWNWYGYGTITPYQNPLAPKGEYRHIPAEWHSRMGTTPGAIPADGTSLLPELDALANHKSPTAPKKLVSDLTLNTDPKATNGINSPISNQTASETDPLLSPKSRDDEKPVPAILIPPTINPATPVSNPKSGSDSDSGPAARLRIPQRENTETPPPQESTSGAANVGASLRIPLRSAPSETPGGIAAPARSAPKPTEPATPPAVERHNGTALPGNNTEGPDIDVPQAPGIRSPLDTPPISKMNNAPYIARGQQPDTLTEAIRRIAGDVVSDVRQNGQNAIVVVLKRGNIDGAWHAREKLSHVPELRRMTVTFEFANR